MKKKSATYIAGVNTNGFPVLEDSKGASGSILAIKTSGKKSKIQAEIKGDLSNWMNNPNFLSFKVKKLDLAIVVYVDNLRLKRQDLDNIAKIVLDALKNNKYDTAYLFEDDSQIMRLLIEKRRKKDYQNYRTDTFVISFREYAPKKQMTLIEKSEIL